MPAIDRRLIQNFEWPVFTLAALLAGFGILNLISASPEASISGALPPTALRQLIWLGIGMAALLLVLIPDYRNLERAALPFYAVCVVALIAVLMFAPVINGSQRWLSVGGVGGQPSELAKLAVIAVMARLLKRRTANSDIGLSDLLVPGLAVAVPVVLVLRQPDLGTALATTLIAGTFLLIARVRITSLVWMAGAGAAAASFAWFFYLHDYQKKRLFTFLNPDSDPLGSAYHAIQSQIAIGSGGVFGKGFLQGSQSQLDFLPEQQTDFVFSVLAEEWGFVGAGIVLCVYVALLIRGLLIARASKDLFGAYLAVGIVALFFWAGAVNVGMVLGVLPVVGVPLPFFSSGGSALITCLMGVGLLMNISMRRYTF